MAERVLVVHPHRDLVLDTLVATRPDGLDGREQETALAAAAEVLPDGAWPLGPDRSVDGSVLHVVCARSERLAAGLRWTDDPPAGWGTAVRVAARAVLDGLAEPPARRARWMRRGWWDAAGTWVDDVLAATGVARTTDLLPTASGGLSALARVGTTDGWMWLKALPPLLAREPRVVAGLAEVLEGLTGVDGAAALLPRVPVLVAAADDDRPLGARPLGARPLGARPLGALRLGALMLQRDAGPVPDEPAPSDPARLAAQLARLHLATAPSLARLDHDAALDDRRPEALARGLERLVVGGTELHLLERAERAALRAGLAHRQDALLALGHGVLPPVLLHGDFHPWNVARRQGWVAGEEVVLDWTDAAVGPAGADLATLLRPDADPRDVAEVVDAYAAVWVAGHGLDPVVVRREVRAGLAAGRVVQALAYEGIARALEPGTGEGHVGAQALNLRAVASDGAGLPG